MTTQQIIDKHAKDFTSATYSNYMKKCGGYDAYVRSLGGIFAEIHGKAGKVKTYSEFKKRADYVFGLMSIWGFDYNNGSTYWHWGSGSTGRPSADAFYQSTQGRCNSGTIDQLCTGADGRGRTTNCNYGVDTLMRCAGLFYDGGPWWSCDYKKMVESGKGSVVIDREKLRPGDLVHMFKRQITSARVKDWAASDWRHVAVVVEVTDSEIILGDFGSRFVRYKKPYHVMRRTGAGIGPDYDANYKGWAGVHCADLIDDREVVPTLNGIDVASYQTGIEPARVPCDFVIAKVTQGTWYINPDWRRQAEQTLAAGKLLGLYHYSEGKDANGEADYFVKSAAPYIGKALLALDWERQDNGLFGGASGVAYVRAFMDRVHIKTGVWPLLYIQQSEVIARDWSSVAKDCGLWLAQYVVSEIAGYDPNMQHGRTGAWSGPAIWQYSSGGRLSGWNGRLDVNVAYMTRSAWAKYAGADKAEEDIPVPRTIKKGSTGAAVKVMQAALGGLTIDGKFQSKTDEKLRAFQKRKGLTVDGVCGPKTWRALLQTLS